MSCIDTTAWRFYLQGRVSRHRYILPLRVSVDFNRGDRFRTDEIFVSLRTRSNRHSRLVFHVKIAGLESTATRNSRLLLRIPLLWVDIVQLSLTHFYKI